MESKYLERFKKATGLLPLRGNRLIVEVLPKEELKSAGGLILNAPLSDHKSKIERDRAKLAVIVAVGSGYYDEDTGADVAMDVAVGNVVMVSEFGLKYYSEFPGITEYTGETLALARDSDIHCAWDSIESYKTYQKALNS